MINDRIDQIWLLWHSSGLLQKCRTVLKIKDSNVVTLTHSFLNNTTHAVIWGVRKNGGGTPKSSIVMGLSIINQLFWVSPFQETSICPQWINMGPEWKKAIPFAEPCDRAVTLPLQTATWHHKRRFLGMSKNVESARPEFVEIWWIYNNLYLYII